MRSQTRRDALDRPDPISVGRVRCQKLVGRIGNDAEIRCTADRIIAGGGRDPRAKSIRLKLEFATEAGRRHRSAKLLADLNACLARTQRFSKNSANHGTCRGWALNAWDVFFNVMRCLMRKDEGKLIIVERLADQRLGERDYGASAIGERLKSIGLFPRVPINPDEEIAIGARIALPARALRDWFNTRHNPREIAQVLGRSRSSDRRNRGRVRLWGGRKRHILAGRGENQRQTQK